MHSWLTISLSDPRALYLQIIEQVKRRVAVGDLTPGTEIPSIRELAADLKVSVITIKRAYLELEREGVIVTGKAKAPLSPSGQDCRPTFRSVRCAVTWLRRLSWVC